MTCCAWKARHVSSGGWWKAVGRRGREAEQLTRGTHGGGWKNSHKLGENLGDGADTHLEEIEELLNEEKWFVCDVVMVRCHVAASYWRKVDGMTWESVETNR
ncbi:hypothetical protein Scep_016745 [Stephania cephalantha]|uniref:Uncharacterized protein n=1 Tax=Stephania cephalantha TaxID=152367 RepID=A0AAP0IQ63_9MAGN